ncbi:MAG: STAS domain-containing protein [Actinomycetota bacterium]
MLEARVAGRDGSLALVQLEGEIADGSFGPWSEELTRLVQQAVATAEHTGVTIDMSGLRFIDLEGVAILLRLAQRTRSTGKTFRLRGADGQVAKKLGETGVLSYLSG